MGHKNVDFNTGRADRVKQLIKESGKSQEEFAETIAFYTPQHLSRIVNGRSPVTWELAAKIAEAFPDIRIEWIMGLDDYRTIDDRVQKSVTIRERKLTGFMNILQLHNYALDDVTADMPCMTDEEGKEYQNTTYKLTSPRGVSRFLSELELFNLICDFDNYLEMRCAFEFRRLTDGVNNIYEWEA